MDNKYNYSNALKMYKDRLKEINNYLDLVSGTDVIDIPGLVSEKIRLVASIKEIENIMNK